MGRMRPRGSSLQRNVGRAVSKGLNEYHKNNPSNGNGCLIIFIIIIVLFAIINACSG